MPRIFHVTLRKEFDLTIVADSEQELRDALEEQEQNVEDWATDLEWEFHVSDPVKMFAKHPERIPLQFAEPDMGMDASGDLVDISDYAAENPDYMKAVAEDAKAAAQKASAEKLNLKLFPESG